jgi:hypothetical protein
MRSGDPVTQEQRRNANQLHHGPATARRRSTLLDKFIEYNVLKSIHIGALLVICC